MNKYKFTQHISEEEKFIVLIEAIQEGLNSGIVEDFDPKEHLKQLKSKRKKSVL